LPLSQAKGVGLKNYIDVLTSGELTTSIGRTCLYVAITMPISIAISLIFSALLNNKLKGTKVWRFIYFSPFVTSSVSVALIFAQLYQGTELGWINALLLKFGLIRDPLLFLSDEKSFLYCVMVLAIWHGLAFNILIFLAALQHVPSQLYRAAEVDGAGWFRKFWHVSLPGIRPQILFISIMGVIGGFQVFEQIFMLGGGSGYAGAKFGPNDAGLTMVPYIYNAGFEKFKMGLSSAIAYILFAIIFVLTLIQMRITREGNGSGAPSNKRPIVT
jgi:multiple sugar transport system permease protein